MAEATFKLRFRIRWRWLLIALLLLSTGIEAAGCAAASAVKRLALWLCTRQVVE